MSDAERAVQHDIQANARLMQKRRTSEQLHDVKGGSSSRSDKVEHLLCGTEFVSVFV